MMTSSIFPPHNPLILTWHRGEGNKQFESYYIWSFDIASSRKVAVGVEVSSHDTGEGILIETTHISVFAILVSLRPLFIPLMQPLC